MNERNLTDTRHGLDRVGIVILLLLGAMWAKQYFDLDLLARTGQATPGVVIAENCSNHGRVAFGYSVDQVSYQGSATAAACGFGRCGKALVGKRVEVVYSRDKPGLAVCAPLQKERTGMAYSGLALMLVGASLVYGFYRMKRGSR